MRAEYDFEDRDYSALTLKQGDLIYVVTQLKSGWCDGILDRTHERGWFPINYCAPCNRTQHLNP